MTTAPERTRPAATRQDGPNVGRPVDRVDGVAKTTGAAKYSADFPYADIAHAALVHAGIARGRVTAIDTGAAEAVPGVLKVLTHQNAPRMAPPPKVSIADLSTMAPGTPVNYLNTDEVHWNGQPVAVVVAESLEAAHAAARLVRVSYEQQPATTDFAVAREHPKQVKNSMIDVGEARKGDAERALADAPVTVDLRYTTPGQNHNAIEPHATTAAWDGDRLTVHDATQNIDWTRKHLALRFGVPAAQVRVVATFVGGGFGGKGSVWAGTLLTALAARATGRPVRMALSRESVSRTVGGRAPTVQRVALGAERDGTLTALVHTGLTQVGRVGGGAERVASQSQYLYAAPAILVRHSTAEVDALPNTFMRAPGEAVGSFALESAIDELAGELGMDPIDLRVRNEPERSPLSGKRFSRRDLRRVYARGADRFGWAGRDPKPRSMRDGRWLVGWGVASALHIPVPLPGDVLVRLRADGTVLVRSGLQEIGVGIATIVAQVTADALGVPLDVVSVEIGDSDQPTAPGAGGSTQTSAATAAVLQACEELKRSALGLARRAASSPLRGARPGDVETRDGGLRLAGGAGESYAEILGRAGVPALEARTGSDSRLGQAVGQARFMARFLNDRRRWVHPATGVHFCEVRVDPDTAEVRVSRWLGVFDVGRVMNAKLAGSQLRGGVVMGIGAALSEETLVDPRTGRIMNPGLGEYHVPVHADVPRIDIECLDEPDPTTPLGLIGAGEVGITGVAAAVANAVHHATGVRVRDLPVTLDRLL
ncbi:xanthine dehydrogenase family protein molybdopterin-binding subunit [Actinoplanes sp. NBRC 103695]|uniref:xanthine dehydrogenase family protein molybdopterin-binding subunit n=1 Tax=Actinoplanes sp. NBRC 103695 TaxID=3032202 RepID=UPI0024A3BE2D|nr:xanthine dehydrogenase family protein molybdopterin-binding subunit [Actinoplanes sp. NBRC 103695]GLY94831.1 carbon-monoxide dehydrogenase large subunit [Actinoplanes sp. NBRC 103695]